MEIKNYDEVLSVSAIEYYNSLLAKLYINNSSILNIPLCINCINLLFVQMFGFLERKKQIYDFFLAEHNMKQKYMLYSQPHNITFKFEHIINNYFSLFTNNTKCMYDVKNRKMNDNNMQKNVKIKISSNLFNILIKVLGDINKFNFNDNILLILNNEYIYFKNSGLYDIINNSLLNKNIFDKNDKVYYLMENIFNYAYSYRHRVAHNLDFGCKTSSISFDTLYNEDYLCWNKVAYLYIIFVVDSIFLELYNKIKYSICN